MKKVIILCYLLIILASSFILFSSVVFAAEKKVALLPLEIYADESKAFLRQGLKNMLISRLSGGDILFVEEAAISDLLKEGEDKGITSKERAVELLHALRADYAVFGSITSLGREYSLDLSLLDLTQEDEKITNVSEAVDEEQLITRLSDVAYQIRAAIDGIDLRRQAMVAGQGISSESESAKGLFFKPTEKYYSFQPTGSLPIRMEILSFDIGDLDGDGEEDLLVLGRQILMVYSKNEGTYTLKDKLEPAWGCEFLKVSVGDVNGNGKAEFCVSSHDNGRAKSGIWEWDGKFNNIYNTVGHLQILSGSDRFRPILLFQDSILGRIFYGDIWVMDYNDQNLPEKKEILSVPGGTQFYTLTFCDVNNDGIPEILGLENPDMYEFARLFLWDREGKELWRSDESFGGTNNIIYSRGATENAYDNPGQRVPFNTRPVIMDIDNDGQDEVLCVKGITFLDILKNFKVFNKGKLTAFEIEGASLNPSWSSREIRFNIVDMKVENGILFLAGHKPRLTNFEKGSGRVMWFE